MTKNTTNMKITIYKTYKKWTNEEIYFILKYADTVYTQDFAKLFYVSNNSITSLINRYKNY